MKTIILLAAALALGGCATSFEPGPKAEDISDSAAGPKPTLEEVRGYMSSNLKDPDSAKFRREHTFKCYQRGAPVSGGKIVAYGWCTFGEYTAKNSYGGYVGYEMYRVFTQNGRMRTFRGNMYFQEWWLKE